MTLRIPTAFLVIALGLTRGAAAQTAPDDLRELARRGQWNELARKGKAAADRLVRDSIRDPIPFSEVAAYRALAHLQAGESREALWHWQAALNFAPDVATREIARFPEAAVVLSRTALPLPLQTRHDPHVRPARPRQTVAPASLERKGRKPLAFSVQFVVGSDGIPHSPRVVGEVVGEWDRVYDALESLRQWRYSPASTSAGPVEFPTAVNLKLGFDRVPGQKGRRF